MAYRLKQGEAVGDGIKRIVREQIDRAIAEIDDPALDRDEAIHQVRKRCKKIRGVLRLVRGPLEDADLYGFENAWYRDAARRVSGVRDAEAMVECHRKVVESSGEGRGAAAAAIGEVLVARRDAAVSGSGDVADKLAAFRGAMAEARLRVGSWPLGDGFGGLRPGLKATYARGRKAMDAAYRRRTTARFHDWRKRVKYHWYQCRVLSEIWPPVMGARVKALSELSDLLGDDHDLAVLHDTLSAEPAPFGGRGAIASYLGLIGARRAALQAEARTLGRRLYAEKPKALIRRFGAYWDAWCEESERAAGRAAAE